MNDQAPRTTLTEAEQAQAERLLKGFLGKSPPDSMPLLRTYVSSRTKSGFYQELLVVLSAVYGDGYDDGYDDGFAEGSAVPDEDPDFNEGYE